MFRFVFRIFPMKSFSPGLSVCFIGVTSFFKQLLFQSAVSGARLPQVLAAVSFLRPIRDHFFGSFSGVFILFKCHHKDGRGVWIGFSIIRFHKINHK